MCVLQFATSSDYPPKQIIHDYIQIITQQGLYHVLQCGYTIYQCEPIEPDHDLPLKEVYNGLHWHLYTHQIKSPLHITQTEILYVAAI